MKENTTNKTIKELENQQIDGYKTPLISKLKKQLNNLARKKNNKVADNKILAERKFKENNKRQSTAIDDTIENN